ncbi:hypothetical protein FOZ63_003419, partial [Perkinsus olseni]
MAVLCLCRNSPTLLDSDIPPDLVPHVKGSYPSYHLLATTILSKYLKKVCIRSETHTRLLIAIPRGGCFLTVLLSITTVGASFKTRATNLLSTEYGMGETGPAYLTKRKFVNQE